MDNYTQSRCISPGRHNGTLVTCVRHGSRKSICSQRVIWPLTCVRHGCGTLRTLCQPCRPYKGAARLAHQAEHEARIARYVQRYWDGEMTAWQKQQAIRTENEMWRNRK